MNHSLVVSLAFPQLFAESVEAKGVAVLSD